jgi:DNA-binding MarR family transcriptional regulator
MHIGPRSYAVFGKMSKAARRNAVPANKTRRPPRLTTADYAELAAFRRTLREFIRFSENAATQARLTSRHYQAMLMLRGRQDGPQVSIDDLARELLIKHNSAVGLVDRLVREGLVSRKRSATDGRRVELQLTSKGRRVLSRLAAVHRVELQRIGPRLRKFFAHMSASLAG